MKSKAFIFIAFLFLIASFSGAFIYKKYFDEEPLIITNDVNPSVYSQINSEINEDLENGFITASERSTPAVVFIKTISEYQRRSNFWFFDFDPFGSIGKVASSGSGVIVSADGYIVTNQHVVKSADEIEVVISGTNRGYKAKMVGSDASTDLALLKIDARDLPAIQFANSDETRIGQWVLAVGNPFNLNSTVTAGIISAKGRNINVVNNQFPIESFIQTDAAINPGNSGGALVNLHGELIGVNTAIASKTGSYVGYGFAIPSNIVAKTINDLKEYGQVQRAFLGVDVQDIDWEARNKLEVENGVLVRRVNGTNAHLENRIEAGDVILSLDEVLIKDKQSFDEQLAYRRPGENIKVGLSRNGKNISFSTKVVNANGSTELIERHSFFSEILGAEFEEVSKLEMQSLKIDGGIKVANITSGKLRQWNIPEGFIFLSVNQKQFDSVKDFVAYLEQVRGQVRIEGVSQNGSRQFLSFYL